MPLRIDYRPIDALLPYAQNARQHPEDQLSRLATSIREHGFCVPVLIDADGTLISGHGRVDAARRAGLTEIPTIALDHLSPEQARVFRLADNKLATLAEWDDELLRQELEQLRDAGVDLGLTGFGDQELTDLFAIASDAKTVKLHNGAILVTAIGSLAIRVGSQFAKSRKLGKTHQNVLTFFKGTVDGFKSDFELRTAHANVMVFAKGSARTATAAVGEVEVGEVDDSASPETEE